MVIENYSVHYILLNDIVYFVWICWVLKKLYIGSIVQIAAKIFTENENETIRNVRNKQNLIQKREREAGKERWNIEETRRHKF